MYAGDVISYETRTMTSSFNPLDYMKPLCVIWDLDGTLVDIEHRVHHVRNKPKNWKAFYAESSKDEAYDDMCGLFSMFDNTGFTNIIVTGREGTEKHREQTMNWLIENEVVPHRLFMRPEKDHRQDFIVKEEILKEIQKDYDVFMAFEDRNQVVEMYRKNGVRCLQVREGNF